MNILRMAIKRNQRPFGLGFPGFRFPTGTRNGFWVERRLVRIALETLQIWLLRRHGCFPGGDDGVESLIDIWLPKGRLGP